MTRAWITVLALATLVACSSKERRCAGSAECAVGTVCADGACTAVACATDRECDLGAVCQDAACVAGCRNGLDCPPALPICAAGEGAVGTCAACSSAADCPDGFSCVDRQCRQPCRDDGNCASGHCDPEARWCVDCTADEHCAAGNLCVDQGCVAGCDDDTTCPVDRPRCVADRGAHGACVECRGSADCPVGTCRSDGTCGAPEPIDAGVGAPDADVAVPDAGAPAPDAGAADAGPPPSGVALDVLFVIDNSSYMEEEQAALIAAFPSFRAELERLVGRRPDLHLGVVSTDLGTGSGLFTACPGPPSGDGAVLQAQARTAGCAAPTGAYLRDVAAGSARDTNYTGGLDGAFACIAALGTSGCHYEQPLAALTRALDGSVAGNAGFLRPTAALAVIILSDEDDCSASNNALFDLFSTTLGPADSFRCFAQGVRCDPDDPRATGGKLGCGPRAGSAYLPLPAGYADALRARKPDGRVAVAVLAGPATPVTVARDSESTSEYLEPSCGGASTTRYGAPGVRLASFAAAFGARGAMSSVCADLAPPLRSFAATVADMLASP